jgi:hypothetical protein
MNALAWALAPVQCAFPESKCSIRGSKDLGNCKNGGNEGGMVTSAWMYIFHMFMQSTSLEWKRTYLYSGKREGKAFYLLPFFDAQPDPPHPYFDA